MGAWIETLPIDGAEVWVTVAPRVGAWIETLYVRVMFMMALCRAPRGRVD